MDYKLTVTGSALEDGTIPQLVLNYRLTMLAWKYFSNNSGIPLNEATTKLLNIEDPEGTADATAHLMVAAVKCYDKVHNTEQELDLDLAYDLLDVMSKNNPLELKRFYETVLSTQQESKKSEKKHKGQVSLGKHKPLSTTEI